MMCEPDSSTQDELCQRCEKNILLKPAGRNAISSVDRKTPVCLECGKEESQINWMINNDKKKFIPKESLKRENKFRNKKGVKQIE